MDRAAHSAYLQLTNVTNTNYQEIMGIDMPGRRSWWDLKSKFVDIKNSALRFGIFLPNQ